MNGARDVPARSMTDRGANSRMELSAGLSETLRAGTSRAPFVGLILLLELSIRQLGCYAS